MTEAGESSAAHVVRVQALDAVVRLEVADSDAAEIVRREWSRCLVALADPAEIPIPVSTGDVGSDRWGYALASQITRIAIEAAAGRYLMFHAAAVSDSLGRTLVLVAPSGTGKTTAAAALGRAGFGYLTDEAVAIDDGDRVLPYPKPLSVVQPEGGKAQHGPDDLDLGVASTHAQVRRLVLLDRVDGEVPARLEHVPLLDALMALIPQTSALPAMSRPLQRLCALIQRCGGVHRLTYAQIDDAAGLLSAHLTGPAEPIEEWAELVAPAAVRPAAAGGGTLSRDAVVDSVRAGDEALLLVDAVPIRLSPVGLSVWLAAGGAAALPDLVDAAVRDHGPHPDAEAVVRDAVQRLLAVGALTSERPGHGRFHESRTQISSESDRSRRDSL